MLLPRALEGTFVVYTDSNRILRIYIAKELRIIETRQVKFPTAIAGQVSLPEETSIPPLPPLQNRPDAPTVQDQPPPPSELEEEGPNKQLQIEMEAEQQQPSESPV